MTVRTVLGVATLLIACLGGLVPVAQAADAAGAPRPTPKILSASWGTDNAVSCPTGQKNLDNIPVTFNWFIAPSSVQPSAFLVVRSDGTTVTPTCALQFPPDEADELQTVNLIGDFGDGVNGPTPVAVRLVGELQGAPPGSTKLQAIAGLPDTKVDPLPAGPYIVDAWTLTPKIYAGDKNACTTGQRFVRVMWSNGLTASGTGAEVGQAVVSSYRAIYRYPGGSLHAIAPLALADLNDHASSFNADNMHDLCLPAIHKGARLVAITIGANLIQDPNGDPNQAQRFAVH